MACVRTALHLGDGRRGRSGSSCDAEEEFGRYGTKALHFLSSTVPQIYFGIKPWQPARRRARPRGPAGRARAFVAAFAWRERYP